MQEGKALVEISVPAINNTYDVYIPLDCKMRNILLLVSQTIKDLSDGVFLPSNETVLCDFNSGQIYDLTKYAKDLNIKNGSKILMI